MQEDCSICESNPNKLIFEPNYKGKKITPIIITEANPKIRIFPLKRLWIDVPIFV